MRPKKGSIFKYVENMSFWAKIWIFKKKNMLFFEIGWSENFAVEFV